MEVIKIHNLKIAKQIIALDLQNKIKLDIYQSLHYAFIHSRKIFDLLIITYYKSIDFNKNFNDKIPILNYMIKIKSKHLNFILTTFKINIDNIKFIIYELSYKSFKFLLKSIINNFDTYFVFSSLCQDKSLKFIKLFIKSLNITKKSLFELIFKKDIFNRSSLDLACGNKLNVVKYLIKFIKSIDSKSIDSKSIDFNINMLIEAKDKIDITKYLLENFKFNLNQQNEYYNTVMHFAKKIDVIKILFKYDGKIDLEIRNNHNKLPIYYIEKVKLYKFLRKYTDPDKQDKKTFKNPEIFKFNGYQ